MIDAELCEKARLSRDARFDGRFFIGVVTTGIYCRPVCPVQPPKKKNVRFYPTAAAAAEAGFRPCLRCRPESSPGTPAWCGTSATVSRGLRMIEAGALDDGSVDDLAERLGVGARHLRRLFLQHLGATPIAIAQTRRLHFAKKLIDETQLSMSEIAFSSGYGSIRRFNSTFQKTYGRPPIELRRARLEPTPNGSSEVFKFQLAYRPPYDWNAIARFLAAHATPGVESASEHFYRRSIVLNGKAGWIEVRKAKGKDALELLVRFSDSRGLFEIVERVRRMFDVAADPEEIANCLRGDRVLRPLVKARPGLRLPGAWDGFETAVRTILGQQVSVAGATTLAGRLVNRFGESLNGSGADGLTFLFPTPEKLARADLSAIGLPKSRAEAIRGLARAVAEGRIVFGSTITLDEFVERMVTLPGIGDWTAHYVAMRALGEPDAFPAADLALIKMFSTEEKAITVRELIARAEAWRPWRGYAAMHLWKEYTERRTGTQRKIKDQGTKDQRSKSKR